MKILIFIYLICLVFLFYMMIRNEKVAGLQLALVKLSHNVLSDYLDSLKDDEEFDKEYYDKLCKYRDEICNISYNKMLWSIARPLTIEEWLTDEQIEFIKLKFETMEQKEKLVMRYINDMCIHCLTDSTCSLGYTDCDGTGCCDYECCDNEVT